MRHQHQTMALVLLLTVCCLSSCRQDDDVVQPTPTPVQPVDSVVSAYQGLYVLCEGNMGSNKATLDYLDLASGIYYQNIFPSRNPQQVKELGDVGNDAKIYGSRLWLVINCSNKVEVCDAATARSLGHVDIPNCRYLAFHEGYAYVSSYVGTVGGTSVLGSVYKVDTLTLKVEGRISVGYQPEEMAVVDGRLYVANSGGYSAMQGKGYDRTVSVIDLKSFTEEKKLDVAPNLFRLRADRYGQLWVSSRGDNDQNPSRLYLLKSEGGALQLSKTFDLAISDLSFRGDSLCYLATTAGSYETGVIDIRTATVTSRQLVNPDFRYTIETPYGLAVHPETGHVYVMDATNYVSNGWLYCFDPEGHYLWRASTGDIPGHSVFLPKQVGTNQPSEEPEEPEEPVSYSPYILAVDEYVPAPGQFVNTLPAADENDTPATMAEKCTAAIGGGKGGMITLGAWGGYVTFHFDHPVVNVEGERDFAVWGNAFVNNPEPAIVYVSVDTNGNGLPDDAWYKLRGSEYDNPKTIHGYQLTYTYAPLQSVAWTDNQGGEGVVARNTFHKQEYFPLWLTEGGQLTLNGSRLPDNAYFENGTFKLPAYDYGYADNQPNSDREGCSLDISWAVDADGNPVSLSHVDFIRCQNAMNQVCGNIGETSTEITGAEDLHPDARINFNK